MSVAALLARLQAQQAPSVTTTLLVGQVSPLSAPETEGNKVTSVVTDLLPQESASEGAGNKVTGVTVESGILERDNTRDDLRVAVQTAVMLADLVPVAQPKITGALDDLLKAELARDDEAIDRAVLELEKLCLRVWGYFESKQNQERKVA